MSWGMVIIFLLFTLASVYFGNPGVRSAVVVKPAVSLEQAIRIVRTDFEIPEKCADFTSGYIGDINAQSWSLQWTVPGRPDLGCQAQVNAATGEVVSFKNCMAAENSPGFNLREPAVSMDQARDIATKLLNSVAVKHVAELRPAQDEVNIHGGPVGYTFHWERVVNGVPFPANGVSIEVSGDTGQVTGYYLSCMQAAFPDAAKAISPERARQVFEGAGMLELQYYQPGSQGATAGGTQPVLLVYKLVHPSEGVIDAISGVPLVNNINPKLPAGFITNGTQAAVKYDAAAISLTPEEIGEVHKLAGFQSQDQATAAFRKWVPAAARMVLVSADLAADRLAGVYCWNLTLKSDLPNRPDNVTARLNALTGELLGFDYYPVVGSWRWGYLDRAGAHKMAGEFLQAIQLQRFTEVKQEQDFSPTPGWGIKYSPFQHFNYRRMINDIPFPANYMAVNVDTHARRLVHYELNWTSPSFPAPQGALSLQQAYAAFLKNRPQTLIYVRDDRTGIINLVYQPQAQPGMPATDLIDARTGTPLDYNGQPAAPLAVPHRFNDIAGNYAVKEIELLGQAGLFGEYGSAFHPNEPVSAASLLRAVLKLHEGPGGYDQMPDQEVLKQAKDRGWVKEDMQPGNAVTREVLARMVVRMLGLERAAEVRGIYKLPFDDAAAIAPDATGYVALAWGLGIMKEDGSRFNPQQPVSRAEAAAVLFRAFK